MDINNAILSHTKPRVTPNRPSQIPSTSPLSSNTSHANTPITPPPVHGDIAARSTAGPYYPTMQDFLHSFDCLTPERHVDSRSWSATAHDYLVDSPTAFAPQRLDPWNSSVYSNTTQQSNSQRETTGSRFSNDTHHITMQDMMGQSGKRGQTNDTSGFRAQSDSPWFNLSQIHNTAHSHPGDSLGYEDDDQGNMAWLNRESLPIEPLNLGSSGRFSIVKGPAPGWAFASQEHPSKALYNRRPSSFGGFATFDSASSNVMGVPTGPKSAEHRLDYLLDKLYITTNAQQQQYAIKNTYSNKDSPPTHGFLPMLAVSHPHHRPTAYLQTSHAARCSTAPNFRRFSTRYHGMHTESNASAEYLTSDQNCALWMTNLPPDVTHTELLASIRNIGRIWCSFINSPDFIVHHTAAAKVVFYSAEAAQKLLSLSWTTTLVIRGYRVKVAHNRIKYGAAVNNDSTSAGRTSRVLIITGREDFVNQESLMRFFKDRFIFQLDEAFDLIRVAGRAVVEFRFGSYRCQAQMGKMALEKDRPLGFEKAEFGEDPCEVGDTLSSYGIAAERIQGKGL